MKQLTLLLLLFVSPFLMAETSIEAPTVVHVDQSFTVTITSESGETIEQPRLLNQAGIATLAYESDNGEIATTQVRVIHGWLSIVPPLIAIGLALWLKSVIPAIFFGLWAGLWTINGFTIDGGFRALMDIFAVKVVDELTNRDHIAILLFTAMIGGMVGVISRNGGMNGVIKLVVKWANTATRGQLSVFFLGLCVFIDDYTNTLVVGNAVRPVTDKLKISREKLAYLVDSTAAPVSCIAVFTTWIGYQVGLIANSANNIEGMTESAYGIFLNSIPYSFYPILALFFVYLIASSGRDFGPMLAAEKKSYGVSKPATPIDEEIDESKPEPRAINAILPLVALLLTSAIGFYLTGEGDSIQSILSSADVYTSLMWGSFLGAAVAGGLTLSQGIMKLEETVEAWLDGTHLMLPPLVILVLAWTLSSVTVTLGTADFLVTLAGDLLLPAIIPAIVFVLSAASAFATGSSWGVMAIILPLVIPVTWASLATGGAVPAEDMHILYSTVSAVLAGSVWGDHCSPISDTTVLSSLASGCDHIEHVRTQIPYAMLVGAVALLLGIVPTGFGVPWWLTLPLCAGVLVLALKLLGKPSQLE